jgi:hypothetical protein
VDHMQGIEAPGLVSGSARRPRAGLGGRVRVPWGPVHWTTTFPFIMFMPQVKVTSPLLRGVNSTATG